MEGSFFYKNFSAYSFGWWLMTDTGLFREKSTVVWWLISQTNSAFVTKKPTMSKV
jgi:hypothetical protein